MSHHSTHAQTSQCHLEPGLKVLSLNTGGKVGILQIGVPGDIVFFPPHELMYIFPNMNVIENQWIVGSITQHLGPEVENIFTII